MKAKEIPSGNGWIITKIGKKEGSIFLTEQGKNTTNSENAAWFSYQSYADDFLENYGNNIWKSVTW